MYLRAAVQPYRHRHDTAIFAKQINLDGLEVVLLAIADRIEPSVEVEIAHQPAFERDIGDLIGARDLDGRVVIGVPGPVFGDIDLHAQARDFLKTGLGPIRLVVADCDQKVKLAIWQCFAFCSHRYLLLIDDGRSD